MLLIHYFVLRFGRHGFRCARSPRSVSNSEAHTRYVYIGLDVRNLHVELNHRTAAANAFLRVLDGPLRRKRHVVGHFGEAAKVLFQSE